MQPLERSYAKRQNCKFEEKKSTLHYRGIVAARFTYGGQGLEHATISMRVSEMADLTSIHGFRIAPVVKIAFLPENLEIKIKEIYWYRKFPGRIVQETRLVPSNVRIHFHSGSTIGGNISSIL